MLRFWFPFNREDITMKLFEEITSDNPNWQTIESLIPEATNFIDKNKDNQENSMIFEVKLTLICLIIYYVNINTDRLDHILYRDTCLSMLSRLHFHPTDEQTKQLNNAWKKLADSYSLIGQQYSNKNNFGLAEEYYGQAASTYKKLNLVLNQGLNLYNQAIATINNNTPNAWNKFVTALPIFKSAAELLQNDNNAISWRARCEYYTGFCLAMQKQLLAAYPYFQTALPLLQEQHIKLRQANFLLEIAKALHKHEQFNLAKKYFGLAAETYKSAKQYARQSQCEYSQLRCNNPPKLTASQLVTTTEHDDSMDVDISSSQPAAMPSYQRYQLTSSA